MARGTLRATFGPWLAGLAATLILAAEAAADEYVDLHPTATPGAASMGAVSAGVYRLPPGIGAVTVNISGYGHIPPDESHGQYQYLYVQLSISNNGDEPFTVIPSACYTLDNRGHRVAGAGLFSGQTRLATATVSPGGRDDLELGFPLAAEADFATLTTITVDWAYAYGGRRYTTIVPLAKTGGGPAVSRAAPSATAGATQRVYVLPGPAFTAAPQYVPAQAVAPVYVVQPYVPPQYIMSAYADPYSWGPGGRLVYTTTSVGWNITSSGWQYERGGPRAGHSHSSWRHHGSDWNSGPFYDPYGFSGGSFIPYGIGYSLGGGPYNAYPTGYGGSIGFSTYYGQAIPAGDPPGRSHPPAATRALGPVTQGPAPRAAAPRTPATWKSIGLTTASHATLLPRPAVPTAPRTTSLPARDLGLASLKSTTSSAWSTLGLTTSSSMVPRAVPTTRTTSVLPTSGTAMVRSSGPAVRSATATPRSVTSTSRSAGATARSGGRAGGGVRGGTQRR